MVHWGTVFEIQCWEVRPTKWQVKTRNKRLLFQLAFKNTKWRTKDAWQKTFLDIKSHCWAILNVTSLSWKSVGRASFLPWCPVQVAIHTAWSLEHPFGYGCPSPVRLPRGRHVQLGEWDYRHCLSADSLVSIQCPTDDPIWQCMWSKDRRWYSRSCPRSQKRWYYYP